MHDYDIREEELIALRAMWEAARTPFGDPARRLSYNEAVKVIHTAIAESDFDKRRDPDRVMPIGAEEVLANLDELGYVHVAHDNAVEGDNDHYLVWMPVFVGWMLEDLKDGIPTPSTIMETHTHRALIGIGDLDVAIGCLLGDQTREDLILRVNEDCFLNALEHGLIKQFGAGNRFTITPKGRDHALWSALNQIETLKGNNP